MSTQLKAVAPDLWIAEMPASKLGFEFDARMSVVRLPDATLWIHSPIELSTRLRAETEALGKVAFIVTPFSRHYMHLAEWARAFPDALVFGAPGLTQATVQTKLHDFLDDTPNAAWSSVLDQMIFRGNKLDTEVDFLHKPSKTLIVADLCFNIPSRRSFSTRIIARLLGILNRVAPSPTFRFGARGDTEKSEIRKSLQRLLEWDFDRVILSHGDIIERNGKARVRAAFARFFAK